MSEPIERWREARARMLAEVECMLFFDFGLSGREMHGRAAWLLDEVVRPEFEKALGFTSPDEWCAMALQDDGTSVVLQSGLSKAEAVAQLETFEGRGEKRCWAQRA